MRDEAALSISTRLELLRTMVLLRTFHDTLRREADAAQPGRPGPAGGGPAVRRGPARPGGMRRSLLGCEPMAAGFGVHLEVDDAVVSPRRPHYMAIARGIDLGSVVTEALAVAHGHAVAGAPGREPSPLGDVQQLRPSATGASYLPALGQAFGFQQKGTSQVAVSILSRAATHQDGFWSAVRVAGTWGLPLVLLLCDDGNTPATATPDGGEHLTIPAPDVPTAYVTSDAVDGACLAAGAAIRQARSGGGPSIVEVRTVWPAPPPTAMAGGQPAGDVVGHDPLATYQALLRRDGILDDDLLATIRTEARARVARAVNSAAARHHDAGPRSCPLCAQKAAS